MGDATGAECIICLSSLESDLLAAPCGHVYHENCLTTWVNVNKSCPLCKKHVEMFDCTALHVVFKLSDLPPNEYWEHRLKSIQTHLSNLEKTVCNEESIILSENTEVANIQQTRDIMSAELDDSNDTLEFGDTMFQEEISEIRSKHTTLKQEVSGVQTPLLAIIQMWITQEKDFKRFYNEHIRSKLQFSEVEIEFIDPDPLINELSSLAQFLMRLKACEERKLSRFEKRYQELIDVRDSYGECVSQFPNKSRKILQSELLKLNPPKRKSIAKPSMTGFQAKRGVHRASSGAHHAFDMLSAIDGDGEAFDRFNARNIVGSAREISRVPLRVEQPRISVDHLLQSAKKDSKVLWKNMYVA